MAVLAHELRNFLSPIATAVAALKVRGGGDPLTAQACAAADRQVRNMTRLVNDLLDVARIARGKARLAREPLDLGAVAAEAAEAVRPLLDDRGHRFETV